MSYCVNCGVELEASLKACPLCHTPVINPNKASAEISADSPFPLRSGQVDKVSHSDLSIFITVVLGTIAVTCGLLNLLIFNSALWSLPVFSFCLFLWAALLPATLFPTISAYGAVALDSAALLLSMLLITGLTKDSAWYLHIALPLTCTASALSLLLIFFIRRFPFSMLVGMLYFFILAALLCVTVEILLDLFYTGSIKLTWSAVVLTVCAIFSVALITILSVSRLRNTVRKRLHF